MASFHTRATLMLDLCVKSAVLLLSAGAITSILYHRYVLATILLAADFVVFFCPRPNFTNATASRLARAVTIPMTERHYKICQPIRLKFTRKK